MLQKNVTLDVNFMQNYELRQGIMTGQCDVMNRNDDVTV
jgi:hypothetical protein